MPSPFDLADLPFLREALVEVILLGARGRAAERVDRAAAARLLHARRRVGDLPGLVVAADAWGISPLLAGMAVALGYAGGVERAGTRRARAERGDRAAAGRRARRRGRAGQRRVRVGRRGRPAAVRHPARARHRRPGAVRRDRRARGPRHRSRSAARGRRSPSTPTARPPSACPRRAPTSCCWRSSRWRRSRRSRRWAPCWWPRSTCCPAPRRGWSLARSRRCWPGRSRSRSPRACVGLYARVLARSAAGPAGGGARRARLRRARAGHRPCATLARAATA